MCVPACACVCVFVLVWAFCWFCVCVWVGVCVCACGLVCTVSACPYLHRCLFLEIADAQLEGGHSPGGQVCFCSFILRHTDGPPTHSLPAPAKSVPRFSSGPTSPFHLGPKVWPGRRCGLTPSGGPFGGERLIELVTCECCQT